MKRRRTRAPETDDQIPADRVTIDGAKENPYDPYNLGIYSRKGTRTFDRQPHEVDEKSLFYFATQLTTFEGTIAPKPPECEWCSCCGQWVNRRGFSPDKRKRSGVQSVCKQCRAELERKHSLTRKR